MAAYLEQSPVLRLDKGCDPGDLKPVAPGVFLPLRRDRNNRNTPYPRFPVRALKHDGSSTIQRKFPTAHIERVQGTARQNRDYIAKEGKWADTEKAETSVAGSFYEWGTLPTEQEEHSPAMSRLLQSVKEGRSTMEIIEETPASPSRQETLTHYGRP